MDIPQVGHERISLYFSWSSYYIATEFLWFTHLVACQKRKQGLAWLIFNKSMAGFLKKKFKCSQTICLVTCSRILLRNNVKITDLHFLESFYLKKIKQHLPLLCIMSALLLFVSLQGYQYCSVITFTFNTLRLPSIGHEYLKLFTVFHCSLINSWALIFLLIIYDFPF